MLDELLAKAEAATPPPDSDKPAWKEAMSRFIVTDDQVARIEQTEIIWKSVLPHQQYSIWVAPPNGGKTTLAMVAAGDLARDGFDVYYLNLDAAGPQIKEYHQQARAAGFHLVAPMAAGVGEGDVVRVIDYLMLADDLSNVVLFLDTLKKFTEVISKNSAKAFYSKLRACTRRGVTVVALAHTNKHKGEDGLLVPEGTGDLKADADNLMLMYSVDDPLDKVKTVECTFSPDKGGKLRAPVESLQFKILPDRQIEFDVSDVDVFAQRQAADVERNYREAVDHILYLLESGPKSQKEIADSLKDIGVGERSSRKVLRELTGHRWQRERAFQNNAWRYFLFPVSK